MLDPQLGRQLGQQSFPMLLNVVLIRQVYYMLVSRWFILTYLGRVVSETND